MTEEDQLGPSYDGTVMLDIGGDIGALILMTGPELHLTEIEISRADGAAPLADGGGYRPGQAHSHAHAHSHEHGEHHDHVHDENHHHNADGEVIDGAADALRTHVAIRERRGPGGTRYAGIYPNLYTGEYVIWGVDGHAVQTVSITGGEVAQVDWS